MEDEPLNLTIAEELHKQERFPVRVLPVSLLHPVFVGFNYYLRHACASLETNKMIYSKAPHYFLLLSSSPIFSLYFSLTIANFKVLIGTSNVVIWLSLQLPHFHGPSSPSLPSLNSRSFPSSLPLGKECKHILKMFIHHF
jgi:hypothetical protein